MCKDFVEIQGSRNWHCKVLQRGELCILQCVIHVLKGSGIINARFCDKTEGIKFRDDIERSELKKAFTSKKRFGQKILKVFV